MRWRRTVVWLGAAAGIAWLAGVIVLVGLAPQRAGVSLTTIARLTPGMTEADVAAVLGPPTTDRTGRPPARFPAAADARLLEYAGERATAVAEFDAGRLVQCRPVSIRTVSGVERVRLRLNWW